MYCTNCGTQLPDDANFCIACGAVVTDHAPPDMTTGTMDVAALEEQAAPDDLPSLPPGIGLLVVVRGPGAGSRYLLDRDSTSIGRHPDSRVFLDDVTVSRHHAEVERTDEGFRIVDQGSLNGTYLAGERVDDRLLRSGDELQVGRFKLMFVTGDAA